MRQTKINFLLNWALIIFLVAGVVLGVGARFFKLDQVVTILNRDEAALAYNAFLLKNAGVDEWGVHWPLVLESFGDWKLVGYPALLVGLYHFLPLADWVVRLPSALAGFGIVVLSYFYAKKIFRWSTLMSLFFSLLTATAPFLIFYARFAYEANLALFYLLLALFLFWYPAKQLKIRLGLDFLASLILLIAIFTYNTPFLLLPFLVGFVLLIRDLRRWQWYLPTLAMLFGVGVVGLWQLWPVLTQKNEITIFTDPGVFFQFAQFRQNLPNGLLMKFLGNRYVFDLFLILKNFFASFSPNFLSFNPYHPWHAVPGTGQVYLSVYILGSLGLLVVVFQLFSTLFKSLRKKGLWAKFKLWFVKHFIYKAQPEIVWLYLLVIGLAPASVTVDAPHATRSLLFLYAFLVMAGFFVWFLVKRLKKQVLLIFFFSLIVTLEFFNYLPKLFSQYHQAQAEIYQAGFDRRVEEIEIEFPQEKIAVVDPGGYQYILLAWYLKLTPEKYLNQVKRQNPDSVGLRYGEQVGRYHFIVNPEDRQQAERVLLYWDKEKRSWRIKQF